MKILTVYSPEDAGLFRIWERSWRKHGFRPGILSPKEVQKHGTPRKARDARRARLPVHPPRLINFGLPRRAVKNGVLPYQKFGKPGWDKSPLVLFPPGITEAEILNCGRAI